MNMNKALQNLYHAVSDETTTKVNISKLLVDIHYAITGKESENKNNWSKIVNSMADNWPEGGGGSWTVLTEETVTTVADPDYPEDGAYSMLDYIPQITAETVRITFNGTSYECQRTENPPESESYIYGDTDWSFSDYPFFVASASDGNSITTQTEGTYTVKIEVPA